MIARQLWSRTHPNKALPPDDAEGRPTTITLVLAELNKNHGKPEDLVKDVKNTVGADQDIHQGKRPIAAAGPGSLRRRGNAGVSTRQLDGFSEPRHTTGHESRQLLRRQSPT